MKGQVQETRGKKITCVYAEYRKKFHVVGVVG